jgi:hypothetical protein
VINVIKILNFHNVTYVKKIYALTALKNVKSNTKLYAKIVVENAIFVIIFIVKMR